MECLPDQDKEQWLKERVAEDFRVNDPAHRPRYPTFTILRIFKAASPTLKTLTLLLFYEYDEPPLSGTVSFPHPCELVVHASSTAHIVQLEPPQCPSLRRFHVIHDVSLKWPMTTTITRLMPLLTHLKISRLNPSLMGSADVVRSLEYILQQGDPTSAGFPSTLERVLVQMQDQNIYGRHEQGVLRSLMAYQLKNIAVRNARGRIVLLKHATRDASEAVAVTDPNLQFYMGVKAAW